MKNEVIQSVNQAFNKVGFDLRKHSPEILMATGIAGVVVSTVLACKATLRVNDILTESKETIDKIHETAESENVSEEVYSAEDAKRDLTIAYVQTGVKLVKLYAPAVCLGALSLTSIAASHNILKRRNVAIAAAYATLDKGFKEYRSHVVERFGQEIDKEMRYGIKAKTFEETVKNEETGKEKKVKTTLNVADPNMFSDYARIFDERSPYWEKDSEYNLMFLRGEQNYANDRLRTRGYLFLNEVYERLGIPPTKAGQVVGWIYNDKTDKSDGYVDFGIYETAIEKHRDFVNGYERSIILDFNVDGNILESMSYV